MYTPALRGKRGLRDWKYTSKSNSEATADWGCSRKGCSSSITEGLKSPEKGGGFSTQENKTDWGT